MGWSVELTRVRRFQRYIKLAEVSPWWEDSGLSATNMGPLTQLLLLQQPQLATEPQFVTDMLDLAYNLRHRKARDPRDKFFAIRGPAEDLEAGELEPDYNLSVEGVYRGFHEKMRI